MERYHQFDPDVGQTPRFARVRTAIDWKLDRALDLLSNAKQRVFPKNESPNASMVGGTSQFPEWYQRSTGPPRRSGVAKTRIVDWHWRFGKRKKAPVGVPGPEMRGVSAGPPVIPPFSPRSGIYSTATVDFSQLLRMEEQERLIQQDRDRAEREHSRVPPGMDMSSGSTRQSYGLQSGLTTPQRASVNPYSHRRSSTVGVTSWYEHPERERDKRFRSDPFDLEGFSGFKLGESHELDGQPIILRQSDASNYSRRPSTAASGQSREIRTSRYSMGSYYQEKQRESMSIDDRRWSLGSARSTVPGVAL
ncbi:MAG: hypothetical protein M1840_001406 [Geoglossum simile]|nr:MAG: hypothetical protein M1840_001406 [Geoglossum simile]